MSRTWMAIVLAGGATFATRASFLIVAHRMKRIPPRVDRYLRQIPPAALAAILLPSLLRPEGSIDVFQRQVPAAIAAAYVAWRTGRVGPTLFAGLGVLLILERM